jgi:hypothetical protein
MVHPIGATRLVPAVVPAIVTAAVVMDDYDGMIAAIGFAHDRGGTLHFDVTLCGNRCRCDQGSSGEGDQGES